MKQNFGHASSPKESFSMLSGNGSANWDLPVTTKSQFGVKAVYRRLDNSNGIFLGRAIYCHCNEGMPNMDF